MSDTFDKVNYTSLNSIKKENKFSTVKQGQS